jgi:transmembrane sensor
MPDETVPMLTTPLDEPSQEMMDAALDWLLRLGEASPQEREAFVLWLDADPLHARVFHRAEQAWSSPLTSAVAERTAARLPSGPPISEPAAAPSRQPRRRRTLWATAAGLLLAVCLGYLTDLSTRLQADVMTARGEQRRLSLEDGSQALLDSASALALDFSGHLRRARLLHGAVYFDVATEAERPFLLEAGKARVRVLGTAFAVRYLSDELRISVERGSVEISAGEQTLRLEAGEQASLVDGRWNKHGSVYQSLAWTQGRLVFDNAPLTAVVDELRRYYPGWIVLGNGGLQALRVTGNYQLTTPRVTLQALANLANATLSEWPGLLILHQ